MPIVALGVNHHHTSARDLALLGDRLAPLIPGMTAAVDEFSGSAVLATCNRFEVYLESATFHGAVDRFMGLLDVVGLAHLRDDVVVQVDEGAVEHLLEVAAGLDAMVVGEAEIAGQVREALNRADGTISPRLRRLFDTALTTSKAVASQTALGAAGRSVASVGIDLIEQRHGALAGRTVLLIGTGTYARVVVADLLRRGCTDLRVYSASGRADAFADSHPVTPVATDGLAEALRGADAVISCSGAGEPVLAAGSLPGERARPLPLLDLSLAGDVSPEARALPVLAVIDLEEVGRHAPLEHAAALESARDLVRRGVATHLHLEGGRNAAPAVTAMRAHISRIIEDEIAQATRRHDPDTSDAVARALRRVSNELLHTPSVRAAELARTGGLDDYRAALHTLFGIEVEA